MIFLAIGSQETAYPTYLKIKYKALFQNPTLPSSLKTGIVQKSKSGGHIFRKQSLKRKAALWSCKRERDNSSIMKSFV